MNYSPRGPYSMKLFSGFDAVERSAVLFGPPPYIYVSRILLCSADQGYADRNAIFILVMNNITEKVECIYYNGERYERV
ncbi:hypothetical protein [Rhizobium phage RHEph24]|nr:hypothetical protein [Rhizobium phage RHEph24]